MDLDTFKFIYLVGVLALAIVRAYYRLLTRGVGVAVDRKTAGEIALMLQAAAGMAVIPLVFVFSSLLDFANYRFPTWTVWVGSVVLAAGVLLVWRAHAALRENFSSSLQLRQSHVLVTNGLYAHVRHPMYAGLWLVGASNAFLLHNAIAGWSFLLCFGLLYFVRVPREERMMLDRFGDSYRAYMRETGRVVPRFR